MYVHTNTRSTGGDVKRRHEEDFSRIYSCGNGERMFVTHSHVVSEDAGHDWVRKSSEKTMMLTRSDSNQMVQSTTDEDGW